MKKILSFMSIILIITTFLFITGCDNDPLEGTWMQLSNADYGNITLTFLDNGECSMENDFSATQGTYKYSKDNKQITVDFYLWDSPVTFDFTIKNNILNLKDIKDECMIKGDFVKK